MSPKSKPSIGSQTFMREPWGNHDNIALPELVEHARQLGPVALRPRDLLLVDALAPGLLQSGALGREVLIVC